MSEFKFACPSCQQRIAADASWVGQQIACPACNQQITVPAPPAASGPIEPQPVGRLSVPKHVPTPPPQKSAESVAASLAASRPKYAEKSNAGKNAAIAIVCVALLGGVGYAAYKYFGPKNEDTQSTTSKTAGSSAQSNTSDSSSTNSAASAGATANSQATTTASSDTEKKATPQPALSPEEARYGRMSRPAAAAEDAPPPDPSAIPATPVAGTLQNEPFKITKATFERGWLTLGEGSGAIPDKSVKFNLYLPSTESIENRTFKRPDSTDRRLLSVQSKTKRTTTSSTTGFQLQLEFGKKQGYSIPGKIFLSIPGTVTNQIAGTFTAEMK